MKNTIGVIETKFPARIFSSGVFWYATGRRGVFEGTPLGKTRVAEYEAGDDDRIWATCDGIVVTDCEVLS